MDRVFPRVPLSVTASESIVVLVWFRFLSSCSGDSNLNYHSLLSCPPLHILREITHAHTRRDIGKRIITSQIKKPIRRTHDFDDLHPQLRSNCCSCCFSCASPLFNTACTFDRWLSYRLRFWMYSECNSVLGVFSNSAARFWPSPFFTQ